MPGVARGVVGGVEDEAVAEVVADLSDLTTLVGQQVDRLRARLAEIRRTPVPAHVAAEAGAVGDALISAYEHDRAALAHLARDVSTTTLDAVDGARHRIVEALRARQCLAAAVLVGSDWHSPSINHSTGSAAGRHDGRVRAHVDDYKRDRHPDAADHERRWLAEMVDNPGGHPLRALLTGSGMAAFTTALTLALQEAGPGPVLLGRSTYHESRHLVQTSSLGDRVRLVAEDDPGEWSRHLADPPAAVVVDSVANSATMPVTDVPALLGALDRTGRSTLVVLDNTGPSMALQPWRHLPRASRLRLVVLESLTKHAQLGLDRTAAGILVAGEPTASALDDLREHLGTNIADVGAAQLPVPDRAVLQRRLRRIQRNAHVIAGRVRADRLPLRLVHPGCGGLMAITTVHPEASPDRLARMVDSVVAVAGERGVALAEGSSFGFDTTRLYLTAATTRFGTPFLRIAAGTEHALAIRAVAATVADGLAAAIQPVRAPAAVIRAGGPGARTEVVGIR